MKGVFSLVLKSGDQYIEGWVRGYISAVKATKEILRKYEDTMKDPVAKKIFDEMMHELSGMKNSASKIQASSQKV